MKTCKTCRWWGRDWQGCCALVDDIFQGARGFEIRATASDDHNLEARLVTGPDFGCILHEPKPDA